jgi:hypothetical protein
MNKKLIRLTESDLHRIVKESVNRILMESETTLADCDPTLTERDFLFANRHEATYYPEDEDGGEMVEFDWYDKDGGIPFEIDPIFDMTCDEWDSDMIEDIEWGVSDYAPQNIKDLYNQHEQAIDEIMKINKKFFLARVRDEFKIPSTIMWGV